MVCVCTATAKDGLVGKRKANFLYVFNIHSMNTHSNTLAFLLVISRSKHSICFNARLAIRANKIYNRKK